MGEIVWVPYERENDRLVDNCYHYDAAFEFECPKCGELLEDTLNDLDTDAYGMCKTEECPVCHLKFTVEMEECLNDDSYGGLPVDEAAQIWASNGKDEDYMFGYSWDELEAAL